MERLNPADLQLLSSNDNFSHFSFNARERKCLFVNAHGKRFFEAGYPLGIDVDLEGRGVAVADLDQDGRLDLILRAVARQKLVYFHNNLSSAGRFLRVELEGTRSNRDAVGAVVRIREYGQQQMRIKTAGSGFQGQSEGTMHFGLGNAERVDTLRVEWPSGLVQEFSDLPADHIVSIVEGRPIPTVRRPAGRRERAEAKATGAPKWKARSTDGKEWRRPAGIPLLLSFWASWCKPCRAEVPVLNDLYRRLGNRVAIAGLGLGESDPDAVHGFAAKTKPLYALLLSDREAMTDLLDKTFPEGDIPLPAAILFDRNGEPKRVFRGMLDVDALQLETEALLLR